MNAIEFHNVSKKFKKGEKFDSLRDAVPNFVKGLFSLNGSNVSLKNQEFWAAKDVSFDLKKGETLGIIGPNGAGKSTILKMLSRILKPTTGEIKIRGKLSALLEAGAGFHPDLTGRENVYLSGAIIGMKKREIDKKFDSIVAFSELEDFIDTPIKRYSSGMHVRLGFAVAAHMDPEILLIDEVLAVGDMIFQIKCIKKVRSLIEKGVTIIFISHDLRSVAQICKKTIFLLKGEVVLFEDTEKVITAYENKSFEKLLTDGIVYGGDPLLGEVIIKGGAKIISLRIIDLDGNEKSILRSGQDYIVETNVVFETDAINPVPACFIWDDKKQLIYDINTILLQVDSGIFRKGEKCTFKWYVKPHLVGGSYNLGVDISYNDLSGSYDRLVKATTFHIKSSNVGTGIADLNATLEIVR